MAGRGFLLSTRRAFLPPNLPRVRRAPIHLQLDSSAISCARHSGSTITPRSHALRRTPFRNGTSREFHTTRITASATPQVSYGISAAYSGKGERLDHERNNFELRQAQSADTQTVKLPRNRRPRTGQDAFFASHVDNSSSVAFGVADGVGGWTEQGVDPADFSYALCAYMADEARTYNDEPRDGMSRPQYFLERAFSRLIEDENVLAGGSTACLAVADPNGQVEVANLGDSGFVHLRPNAIRYHSPPQTHAFNTPFQLSKIPRRMLRQMALFSGGVQQLGEFPKDAALTSHKMKHGDVLVFGTDGVWDNLSPQDVLQIIGKQMSTYGGWVDSENGIQVSDKLREAANGGGLGSGEAHTLQAVLAQAVVGEAKIASEDRKRDGPFAREVHKHYPQERWHGGKVDDICVVVAIAVESMA